MFIKYLISLSVSIWSVFGKYSASVRQVSDECLANIGTWAAPLAMRVREGSTFAREARSTSHHTSNKTNQFLRPKKVKGPLIEHLHQSPN